MILLSKLRCALLNPSSRPTLRPRTSSSLIPTQSSRHPISTTSNFWFSNTNIPSGQATSKPTVFSVSPWIRPQASWMGKRNSKSRTFQQHRSQVPFNTINHLSFFGNLQTAMQHSTSVTNGLNSIPSFPTDSKSNRNPPTSLPRRSKSQKPTQHGLNTSSNSPG